MKRAYELIYEDQDIVVVNKSAHVLTIQDRFDPTKPNLKELLLRRFQEIYVVHRLDLETSGLLVFAKNEASHAHLNNQFQNRDVKKIYHAICQHPPEESGTIEARIAEHQSKKGIYIAAAKGKEAITDYKVVKSFNRYALVELNIHTGRTHQIRVHMKSIGASLITDKKYGLFEQFYLSQLKRIKISREKIERPLLSRSALHSFRLSFRHPSDEKIINFEAPLPKDMKAVIYQMEKIIV